VTFDGTCERGGSNEQRAPQGIEEGDPLRAAGRGPMSDVQYISAPIPCGDLLAVDCRLYRQKTSLCRHNTRHETRDIDISTTSIQKLLLLAIYQAAVSWVSSRGFLAHLGAHDRTARTTTAPGRPVLWHIVYHSHLWPCCCRLHRVWGFGGVLPVAPSSSSSSRSRSVHGVQEKTDISDASVALAASIPPPPIASSEPVAEPVS
jgi:hypothetical protein